MDHNPGSLQREAVEGEDLGGELLPDPYACNWMWVVTKLFMSAMPMAPPTFWEMFKKLEAMGISGLARN